MRKHSKTFNFQPTFFVTALTHHYYYYDSNAYMIVCLFKFVYYVVFQMQIVIDTLCVFNYQAETEPFNEREKCEHSEIQHIFHLLAVSFSQTNTKNEYVSNRHHNQHAPVPTATHTKRKRHLHVIGTFFVLFFSVLYTIIMS